MAKRGIWDFLNLAIDKTNSKEGISQATQICSEFRKMCMTLSN